MRALWKLSGTCLAFGWLALLCQADDKNPAFLDGDAAGPDFVVQGEYEGTNGKDSRWGAQVVALSDGKFDAVLYPGGLPGAGWDGKTKLALQGETKDGVTRFSSEKYSGQIKDGSFSGHGEGGAVFQLKKVSRRSPTLGAKPPEGALVLFDGSSVDQWENGKLEDGGLLGVGARTKQKFKDYKLHLEFRTPFMPAARGQGRGNSGMYLNDQYEVQVLDSFGLNGENNECGGIYSIAKPLVNMCLPPLAWQTYDVDMQAAKFDESGKKTAPAVVTIRHNGVVIHDKLELPKNTPGGGVNDESKPGAIFLQNHGNPVRFRNIWIVEKK
jgi:hypothetical protein